MEIVIDVPDRIYKIIQNRTLNIMDDEILENALRNGTPLPKGHGDLVDISPYKGKVICSHLYSGVKKLIEVDSIKPIIEAEGSESE